MCDQDHINRNDAALRFARIRQEWEEAACDQDLDDVKGSVGLLLNDVEEAVGFEPGEIRKVILSKFCSEVN